MERVVITGMGAITSTGNNVAELWHTVSQAQSGIGPITQFDASELAVQIAGEVKGFDPIAHFGVKEARRMDRGTHFVAAAAREAIAQSDLDHADTDKTRVGSLVSSAVGGLTSILQQAAVLAEKGPRRVSPFLIPMMLPDTPAAHIAIEYGFMGPSMSITAACATSNYAIGEAFEMISRGSADAMVVGGGDALITPLMLAGFHSMRALSTNNQNPAGACRPFDADRDGFVIAEGAGVLVLESLAHARQRNADILAEVIGYGVATDAHHLTAPRADGQGIVLAIQAALQRAQIEPTQIDYINAHGTGTPMNDRIETAALKQVFGNHVHRVQISGTKSLTGHLLGGSSAIEAIISVKSIETGIIIPTINYQNPDPNCDLNYTPNQVKTQQNINIVLSNAVGFGGHNGVILLKRFTL